MIQEYKHETNIGVGLGVMLSIVLVLARSAIRDLKPSGRRLSFVAEDPQTGAQKRSVFRVESQAHADEFEHALSGLPFAAAA